MTAFDTCFSSVLHAEGGFSNNSRDPGGITNLGVTKRAWEGWVGHSVSENDMRQLTPAMVSPFYRAMYWNAVHGDSLPPPLALCLFHCAVNAGPGRAAKLLQEVLGVTPDGAIGPATLLAVANMVSARVTGLAVLVAAFQNVLRAFYKTLSTFDVFGAGWMNRAQEVEKQALGMIA